MSLDKFVTQSFPIRCRGRKSDPPNKVALAVPVDVIVEVYQHLGNDNSISSKVTCQYNAGGHGEKCHASPLSADKVKGGVICPYAFDIPSVLDSYVSTRDATETAIRDLRHALDNR